MTIRRGASTCCALLLGLLSLQSTARAACPAAEYHRFDFFIGDWDTFDSADDAHVVARNRVDAILDGCAIRERYSQEDGLEGESISFYDPVRQVWHQTWATNHGASLLLDGNMRDDSLVFQAVTADEHGRVQRIRVAWTPQPDGVHEVAQRSSDDGQSWQPLFDIVFRPHHNH